MKGIMRFWALQLPPETVLVADSFFGSHGLAEYFASINRPFLTLSKRNKKDEALTDAKQQLAEGQVARGVIDAYSYKLVVYKNPKVGHKPPPPSPLPNELLVWGVGSPIPRRASIEAGSCMLPRVLTSGGWGLPNGPPTLHHDATNDVGQRGLRLHVAVRSCERLCGMQGSWSLGTHNHHVRVPMGHYPAPLFRRAKVVCIDHVTTNGTCSSEGCREAAV